jgi:chromosome segregation ATPase
MAAVEPRTGASSPTDAGTANEPAGQVPEKRRNWWIWASAGLAVVAAGLLIWGLNTKSDLDKAHKDNKQLQSQLGAGAVAGTAATASYKSAYEDLQQQVGTTSADLSATQKDLKQAEDAAAKAEKDAAAAKKEADQANNQTDKANAEAKQAKADAKAADSKSKITTDCAQAYLTSVGKLFEGNDPSSQEKAVKKELQGITADCKKALAGT